jgi:hypothetical protein
MVGNNAAGLAYRWKNRDKLYAVRKTGRGFAALTEEEEANVRWWRQKEADALPEDERSTAYGILQRWTPPLIHR